MGKGNRKRNERAENTLNMATPRKASQKKEMPTWVGTVIVLVVVVALVAFAVVTALNTRGTFNRMRNVVETDHFEVTVPMMSYMVYNKYQSYVAQIQSYGSGNIQIKGDSTGEALDTNKPLREQTYSAKEGEAVVTWFDNFANQAEADVKQVLACCEAAYEAGVKLEDADYEAIEAELAVFDTYAAQTGYTTNAYVGMMYGEGVRLKDVEKMMELTQLAAKWTEKKAADFFNGVDIDRINAYYTEHQDEYDAYCDIVGYTFTATFTPDQNGDEETNKKLAEEYIADQARYAKFLDNMKAANGDRQKLEAAIWGCLEEEAKHQFLESKGEGYTFDHAKDSPTVSAMATSMNATTYLENVAKDDFKDSNSSLNTWLFESKTVDGKTVYQRKAGEVKEVNDANDVVTTGEDSEKYQKVTSTYAYYIFVNGMHRDYSPSVGHILFQNETYDGLLDSSELDGVVKVLADRLFKENKKVENYMLTADAMAAELIELMIEQGKVSEATREDGTTYYTISNKAFESYGESYTEDSSVFYDGVARGVMVASFEDWAYHADRRAGELSAEAVETEYGYHIMYYKGVAWESGIREKLSTEENDAYLEHIQEGRNIVVKSENYSRIVG